MSRVLKLVSATVGILAGTMQWSAAEPRVHQGDGDGARIEAGAAACVTSEVASTAHPLRVAWAANRSRLMAAGASWHFPGGAGAGKTPRPPPRACSVPTALPPCAYRGRSVAGATRPHCVVDTCANTVV